MAGGSAAIPKLHKRLLRHCRASQRQVGNRDCFGTVMPRKDRWETEIASALSCLAKTGGKQRLLRHCRAWQRRVGNRDCFGTVMPGKDRWETEIASALSCLAKTGGKQRLLRPDKSGLAKTDGKQRLLRHCRASQGQVGNRDCFVAYGSSQRQEEKVTRNDRRETRLRSLFRSV
jgi:hypothetical protein